MAYASVLKYEGDNSTFVWKHPREDFATLTQLIVHESQEAIFMLNGQALDLFGPGRHTLETQNIPGIANALGEAVNGGNPFHCEVYFINKTVQMGIKWGTDSKVRIVEPTLNIPFEIGASGEMNLMVSDSRKLLIKLIGTRNGVAWGECGPAFAKSIQACFRPLIITAVKANLSWAIKELNINLFAIDEQLEALSEILRKKISVGFEEYGLTIPEFYLSNVLLPEEDINFRRLREIQTVSLQTKFAEAEANVTAAQRQIELERQTTETEIAKREAERDIIRAQAAAEAVRMSGLAEADVMHAKGYTQRDVLTADVQKAYAEGIGNMNIGGAGGSVAGDFVGLGVGLAAAGIVNSKMSDMFSGATATEDKKEQAAQDRCPVCNAPCPSNAKFCLECGAKIEKLEANEIICPRCNKKTVKSKFCMECGGALVNKCPKCNAELPLGAKFCLECGEKV